MPRFSHEFSPWGLPEGRIWPFEGTLGLHKIKRPWQCLLKSSISDVNHFRPFFGRSFRPLNIVSQASTFATIPQHLSSDRKSCEAPKNHARFF
jgi:hypothetical protein